MGSPLQAEKSHEVAPVLSYDPAELNLNATTLDKRGCSRSNSGTHCGNPSHVISYDDAEAALQDLLSQCSNGNLPGSAKRVSSKFIGSGAIAYACNGFCRTQFMPCQDAEWSIRRVMNGCEGAGAPKAYEGWDSQETRGTWYGIGFTSENPCGFPYSGRGASY